MALKFSCSVCNKEIITRFLVVGDMARCPNCGSFTDVPGEAEYVVDEESTVLKTIRERRPHAVIAKEPPVIPRFRTTLRYIWQAVKDNIDPAIGAVAIYFAVAVAGNLLSSLMPLDAVKNPGQFVILLLILTALGTPAYAGVTKISLGLAFDKRTHMRDFVATPAQYLRCYFGYLIYFACTSMGLILFIVPGVVFAVTFQFYDFFILKYDTGILEAFRESARLSAGYRNELLGFDIALLLFRSLGLLAFCVGIYITVPLSVGALAYVFSILVKQKGYERELADDTGGELQPAPSISYEVKRPAAYPTIFQGVILTIILIMLSFIIYSPAGFIEEISGYHLTKVVPLEIFSEILAYGLIVVFIMKRSALGVREVIPLKSFNPWILLPICLAMVGMGIMLSELDNITRYVYPEPDFFKQMVEELRADKLRYIILAVVLAPICEEIFFRGNIVRGFRQNYSIRKTILVSALLFGLVHLNPWQFLSAYLGGVVLAWIFIETGSLWPCIFAHALYNGFDLIFSAIFKIEIPGFNYPAHDTVYFQPWWFDVLGVISAVTGIVLMYVVFRRGGKSPHDGSETIRAI